MKKAILICGMVLLLCAVIAAPFAVRAGVQKRTDPRADADGILRRQEVQKTVSVPLAAGQSALAQYDKTRLVSGGYADIYRDENGNDYIFRGGSLCGFYNNGITLPASGCTPIGIAAAEAVAREQLALFLKDADAYAVKRVFEKESYGQYYITFAKKVGNLFLADGAEVWVMYDGAVKSIYLAPGQSEPETDIEILSEITEQDLSSYAQTAMELLYPDADGIFEMQGYELRGDGTVWITGDYMGRTECVQYEVGQ